MAQTFDLEDIKARLNAERISYEARHDILALLAFVEETSTATQRHYQNLLEIADAMHEDDSCVGVWAGEVQDAAELLFVDLCPRLQHADTPHVVVPFAKAHRRERTRG